MADTVDFMVSRIGLIALLLILVKHFGSIKLTVAATGIEKMKTLEVNHVPELVYGSSDLHAKSLMLLLFTM